ncbi:microvitellogenin-like [Manduca sexta]|uniref:microvitellogenin-like n=1 Tax=Manduca sexta TaxID=7130 RepID=UPI00188E3545|nr:microvitellogenin-like [Manduca sexta]
MSLRLVNCRIITMLRIALFLTVAALACHAAPITDDEAIDQLYKSVIIADYETALLQSKNLVNEQRGMIISKTVDKLLEKDPQEVMYYGYYLFNHDAQDIVKNYFPLEFRMIFSQLTVKLINKKYNMELKVGLKTDSDGERTVYGDSGDVGNRAVWKFMNVDASDKKVYFKIYNPSDNQFLKSGNSADRFDDHPIYSSTNSDTFRHQWYLEPVVLDNEILFYVINRQYSQPLKLAQSTDSDGDRQAYGHGGDPSGAPERFGWKIERS